MISSPTSPTFKKRPRKGMSAKERAERQEVFLAAYAETGIILTASHAAGIHRSTVYDWQEHDDEFSLRFHQAQETANEVLRAEIHRRGVLGWEEEVYQLGKYAGTVRKFSDTLLIFEAKRRMPEYRDKVQVSATVQGNVTHEYNIAQDPEAASLAAALIRRLTAGSGPGDASGSRLSRQ